MKKLKYENVYYEELSKFHLSCCTSTRSMQVTALQVRDPSRSKGAIFEKENVPFYNYFRDYDPTIGRYIESDPIGLAGGYNPFLYARANPSQYVDVLGLLPECEILFQTYRRTLDFKVEEKWRSSTTARWIYPVSGSIGPDYGPPNSGKAPFSPEIVFEIWLMERWIAYQEKYNILTTFQQTRYLCKGSTVDECGNEEQWIKIVDDEKEIDRVKKYLGGGFDYGSQRIQFLSTFEWSF